MLSFSHQLDCISAYHPYALPAFLSPNELIDSLLILPDLATLATFLTIHGVVATISPVNVIGGCYPCAYMTSWTVEILMPIGLHGQFPSLQPRDFVGTLPIARVHPR